MLTLIALSWTLVVVADEIPETVEAPPGGDFALVSYQGPVSLEDFRGRVVMLFFGYTNPRPCT